MKKIIAAVMITAILLTAFAGCGKEKTAQTSENTTNEVTKVTSGNALSIPTDELSENVEFYPVDVDGIEMEVIAVKDSTGTIRTAFNTCQICYDCFGMLCNCVW